MANRPFNVVVVLFWLATMSWLAIGKILPPLRVGEPPNYSSIVKASPDEPPVCWRIGLSDKPIGWAATKTVPRKDGMTDLYSRVYLNELPLDELMPPWLSAVLKPVLRNFGPLDIDKTSRLTIDPLGRLIAIESRVRVGHISDAIKVHGQIDGSALKMTVQSGDVAYPLDRYLPPDALMMDELSPQARMPGLRVGQTWTVPLYSPLRPPNSPLEILQATVEREDRITWQGESVNCRIIVYRDDPGSGLTGHEARGRVFVRADGVVLRQEASIARTRLFMDRLPDQQAEAIRAALGQDWNEDLPGPLAKRLVEQIPRERP